MSIGGLEEVFVVLLLDDAFRTEDGRRHDDGNPKAEDFFRYYLVDSSTGVKSQTMLAECKWIPGV